MAMRVLVFDDDAAIGRSVARAATMAGLRAVAVTDAKAFEMSFQSAVPQVVLLDLQLGDTDGIAQLRQLSAWRYAGKLVLMSGFDARVLGAAEALARNLGLKVETALEKPLRLADLEHLFERLSSTGQPPSAARLRDAIVHNEMILEFQPVVTREPRKLEKLEALIRWNHPIAGRIAPAEFLPVAENDTETIDRLTDWVLGASVNAWQDMARRGVKVALGVNISTRNLHDLALPDRIGQMLRSGGMPPGQLAIEVTESAAFSDSERTLDILTRIRLKGMRLSIDDFGTGFSSLKLLRQIPFTEIKIDRSFVKDLTQSRDSRAIVKSIIDLAAHMELGCVAEGVETEETATLLENLGVRHLQGFLIARPMPIEAVPTWLAAWLTRDTRGAGPADGRSRAAASESVPNC
jgi:EAL domain-containing protein (putative c-di-GMP-specific phosphodiesterase class I)/ActR/RegA family two-component response regulator